MRDAQSISSEASARKPKYAAAHGLISEMWQVFNGGMPERFADYFRDVDKEHGLNLFRLGATDMAAMAAKVFSLDVRRRSNSDPAKKEAELVEQVCYSYNDGLFYRGGVDHLSLKKLLMLDLIVGGDAVGIVLPDSRQRSVFFYHRDTKTHLPPLGWTPFSPAPLDDTLFLYKLPLGELKRRYPDARERLQVFDRSTSAPGYYSPKDEDAREIEVIEYYSTEKWSLQTAEHAITLLSSVKGQPGHPGVCPVVPFGIYDGMNVKGRPPFADEVNIQAAVSRMLSQQIEYMDAVIYPLLFHTEVEGGELKRGPGQSNQYVTTPNGPQPRTDKVAPDNPSNVMNSIQFLMGWGRILTRTPEINQGLGDADSAKAINALRAGPEGFIKDEIWPISFNSERRMYSLGMQMDINLWPNVKKEAVGFSSGTPFRVSYRPANALKGYEHAVRIKRSASVGGYQGEVMRMQKKGAGLMTLRHFLEEDEAIEEPARYETELAIEKLTDIQYALFTQKAKGNVLRSDAIPKIIKLMQTKEMSWLEAAEELDKRGELDVPPPEEVAPEQTAIPPEIAMLMGGGQDALAQGAMPGGESLPSPQRMRAAVG